MYFTILKYCFSNTTIILFVSPHFYDVTIPHREPNPNPEVQPHQSNNPTIQVVCHIIYANPKFPRHHTPCITHAPMPCTAQLARQPKPKSDPT